MSDTLDPEAIDGDSSDECLGCFTLKRELAEAQGQLATQTALAEGRLFLLNAQEARHKRELAEARKQSERWEGIAKACNCPTHEADKAILWGQLADAREQRDTAQKALFSATEDYEKVVEQRDTLAEAATKLIHYIKQARAGNSPLIQAQLIEWIDEYTAKTEQSLQVANTALAAVKGGEG
jgi:hypothetical protein